MKKWNIDPIYPFVIGIIVGISVGVLIGVARNTFNTPNQESVYVEPIQDDCEAKEIKICIVYEALGNLKWPCYKLIKEFEAEGVLFYKLQSEDGTIRVKEVDSYLHKFYIEKIN